MILRRGRGLLRGRVLSCRGWVGYVEFWGFRDVGYAYVLSEPKSNQILLQDSERGSHENSFIRFWQYII